MDKYAGSYTSAQVIFDMLRARNITTRDSHKRWFCPASLLAQQLRAMDVHTIDYPVHCWDSARQYKATEMQSWGTRDLTRWTKMCDSQVLERGCA